MESYIFVLGWGKRCRRRVVLVYFDFGRQVVLLLELHLLSLTVVFVYLHL